MRRLLTILPVTLASLLLFALPAFAAEEKATESGPSFIVVLAVLGIGVGLLVFLDAQAMAKGEPEVDDHGHH